MKKFFVVVLFLAGLSSGSRLAADDATQSSPWRNTAPFSATPADVLAAAQAQLASAPTDADVVILWRQVDVQFDAAHRRRFYNRLIYAIRTPDGAAAWAQSKVDYSPWHQERPRLRARVITPDGTVHTLDPKTIVERPSTASDSRGEALVEKRQLEAPLPGIVPGAIVEEEVESIDREPILAAGATSVLHLAMYAPILRQELRLSAPTSVPLRYGVRTPPWYRLPDVTPRREVEGENVRLVFELERMASLPGNTSPGQGRGRIPGLPATQARFPQIAFSTAASWNSVAQDYSRLVDEGTRGAAQTTTFQELQKSVDRRNRAQTELIGPLLKSVRQNVRLIPVDLATATSSPVSPAITLERGFGAPKDLAALLVALLRAEEIPAYIALTRIGFGKDVDTGLPGFGRFNHPLVYVPASPPIWIDPSDPGARAGDLPIHAQGRWALVASPGTEKLRRTPTANSIDNLTREERVVELADHGPSRIVETSTYFGEPERQQRAIARSSDQDERHQGYAAYVETAYLAKSLGEVDETAPDDLESPMQLSLEALDCGRAVTDLAEAVVAIRYENLFASLPEEIREGFGPRRQPYVVAMPYVNEWRYRIKPPTGFVPRELPPDLERRFGPALLTSQSREENGEILLEARFDSGPRILTADQFEELRRGVRAFLNEEPMLLWFDHTGAAALAEGRIRDAIEELRAIAQNEPNKAIHRIRLVQALLSVGLGGEARRQAEIATELEQESALAHWAYGHTLQHDEVGLRFRPGFDREGALVELRTAVALAPRNPLARTELAILLEYDNDGNRYSDAADLDGALAEYRVLRRELGASNLEINEISTLYWAERWADLERATQGGSHKSQVSQYLRLVALTLLNGPEKAIREVTELATRREDQMGLLSVAAQHLVIKRRYREAAILLRRAAAGAPNPAAILRRADALDRALPHESLRPDDGTAVGLARRFLLLLGQKDISMTETAALFHPAVLADRHRPDQPLTDTLLEMQREQVRSAGDLPLDAVTDLALAVLQTQVDGDDELGFRVEMASGLSAEAPPLSLFATLHEGRPVIAALDRDFGQMAREVLRRLERNDLRGAHQWLDWARDSIPLFSSNDPYAFAPFASFWVRGTGAFRDKMTLAAYLLMADQPEAADAVGPLEEALAKTAPADERTRRLLETALLMAYITLEDQAKLGPHSQRLLDQAPNSEIAFVSRAEYLLETNQLEGLQALASDRLSRLPNDANARRYLARLALTNGTPAEAVPHLQAIQTSGLLQVVDYNLWAWIHLFDDALPLEEGLGLALRGAELSQYGDRQILHTLASIQAELGQTPSAYQAIVRSLDLRKDGEPAGEDFFVFGRIAEEHGFPEVARNAYQKVPRQEREGRYTTWHLAQKGLDRLSAPARSRRGQSKAP